MVNLRLVNLRIASAGDGRTMGGIHAASLLPSGSCACNEGLSSSSFFPS